MGSPRQEYCSEWPFPSPENLPEPRIVPKSPALQVGSLLLSHHGSCETFHPFPYVGDVFWFLHMRPLCLGSVLSLLPPTISPSLSPLSSLVPSPPTSIGIYPPCYLDFIVGSCHVQDGRAFKEQGPYSPEF